MWRAFGVSLLLAAGLGAAAADDRGGGFSVADLLAGKTMTEAECRAAAPSVWVTVDGQGDCIRYWMSAAGGTGRDPLIHLHGDVMAMNARNERVVAPDYTTIAPAALERFVRHWSQNRRGPFLHVARPGTFGSSGDHNQRRRLREVLLVEEAISAIKAKHGFRTLHFQGQSGGGHLVAALLARRNDIGCAVISSGVTSVWTRLREIKRTVDVTGYSDPYDPIDDVGKINGHKGLRIFVLTDPEDRVVPLRSQLEYVEKAKAAALPVTHVFAAALDPRNHDLMARGLRLATDCIAGLSTDAIVKKYTNKAP